MDISASYTKVLLEEQGDNTQELLRKRDPRSRAPSRPEIEMAMTARNGKYVEGMAPD